MVVARVTSHDSTAGDVIGQAFQEAQHKLEINTTQPSFTYVHSNADSIPVSGWGCCRRPVINPAVTIVS